MNRDLLAAVAPLQAALVDRTRRQVHIRAFQRSVWNGEIEGTDAAQILRDLAYDLDFYEPDPEKRKDDAGYYGDERLEAELRAVFTRLGIG